MKVLDRITFDKLNIEEQIKYINDELRKGSSLTNICKNIGIGRTTVRDRASKIEYKFSTEINQYVTEHENKNIEKANKIDVSSNSYKHVENITDLKRSKESKNNISEHVITQQLVNSSKDVINMLEWFKNFKNREDEVNEILAWAKEQKERGEIIDIPEITIDPEWINGDVKTRSFTIYLKVLNEFIKFAKKQPFSQQDLMSMALVEYIKKYDR